jgi:hypothetical protein
LEHEEVVIAVTKNAVNITSEIPAEAIESPARCLLPTIREYFESEDGQREYEKWKANQIRKAA